MRLKIGDDFLDLYGTEILAQSFGVNTIGDISSRQSGFSNDFVIPLTALNRSILDYPENINSGSRNPYEKVECELFDGGVSIATGYLKYQIVDSTTLQASFFSDNANWFTLIKDKKLTDLDLSEYDHDWNYSTIATAINANKSSGYTYPLIDYGYFSANDTLYVFSEEMFPAMFVHTVFKQCFFDIGWKVEGELIDHPLFNRMIIPFCAPSFRHSLDYINENSFTEAKDIAQAFSVTTTLTWDNVDTTIAIPATGKYNVVIYLEITGSVVPTDTLDFQINGVSYQILGGITTTGVFRWVIENIDLQATDDLSVIYTVAGGSSVTVTTNSFAQITMLADITRGGELQMSSLMPDISQADFLNYICFAFGALPQANALSKTVSFTLFNSIKNNIPDALDWSNKIDMGSTRQVNFTELLDSYAKRSIITYSEDSEDSELASYQNETGQMFGQGEFNIENDHLQGIETIYEAPFTPMINVNSFSNTMYIPQIKFVVNGVRSIKPSPKIAILSENIAVDTLSANQYDILRIFNDPDEYETDYQDCSSIPFCWFAKTSFIDEVDELTDTLAFDQILFPNAIGDPLIDRFLADYESILNNMKYLSASVHLTDVDISNLDFSVPVYIDAHKAYFYVSKINNYQGSRQVTEVELIKISG
jgi:hypothetical protein